MTTLKKATVEFDKNKKSGKIRIELLTELLEGQDRLSLTERFKKEVEPVLAKDGHTWSNLFKVTGVPVYYSGHKWFEFELELLRDNKPLEWSEGLYKDQITRNVRHLCHFIKDRVDSIEEGVLQDKPPEVLPEVSETIPFAEV